MPRGNGNGTVVRLTDERLRRLERRMGAMEEAVRGVSTRLDETNARLDQAVDVLTRLVQVVAAQNDRMNRNFERLNGRMSLLRELDQQRDSDDEHSPSPLQLNRLQSEIGETSERIVLKFNLHL